MNTQLIYMFLLMGGVLVILLIGEYLHKRKMLAPEYTRKMAHVLGSLSSLLFILVFDSYWYVLAICLFFFLMLLVGKRKQLFNSIEGVKRTTSGSIFLPIAIAVLFVIARTMENSLLFILPVLVLGISDPLAGLAGVHFKKITSRIKMLGTTFQKTYLGSSVFFISAFIISYAILFWWQDTYLHPLLFSLLIAFVATLVELVSTKGYDNLWVPLSVLLFLL